MYEFKREFLVEVQYVPFCVFEILWVILTSYFLILVSLSTAYCLLPVDSTEKKRDNFQKEVLVPGRSNYLECTRSKIGWAYEGTIR